MVYIQLEGRAFLALCYWSAGTDLGVLTFQLLLDCETVIFFLSFIFSLSVSIVFFRRIFRLSPQSHSLSPTRPPFAPDMREQPFCFAPDHSFDYSAFLAYAKSTGCYVVWKTCTDWHFSVMETLVVILNWRWQVKRRKVPFNSAWKENIFFSAKKKNNNKNRETK